MSYFRISYWYYSY